MKKINIYDGFTFVTGLSLNNSRGYYTVGRGEGDYSADFYGLKNNEGVNIQKLISFLKNSKSKLIYENYRGSYVRDSENIGQDGIIETTRIVNVPFSYTNEYKQKIQASIQCGINKKYDYLDKVNANFLIDVKNKNIVGKVVFFYEDTEQYRKDVIDTASKTDFSIYDKYVGVQFLSKKLVDLYYLLKEIKGKENAEWYKILVNQRFIKEFNNCKNVEDLIFLYESAPDFTLATLSKETLWQHICQFYNYDISGTFSFLKDASPQLMRALFAFNTPEKIKYLMEQFHKDQSFIKKIYDALDGSISFMGQEQKCQTVFASIMTSFCFTDISTLNFTNDIFYVGKEYTVNVKEVDSNDKGKQKYWVEQHYKNETSYVDTGTAVIEMGGEHFLMNRLKMNPLDIVTLLQKDTNSLLYVPVLFLKDIDHQKDIANLLTAVRIGVDMLAIGLTIATLGGLSPLLAIVGALEITLNATDILVQIQKDNLGKEFLEKWEKIYTIGGIATASPIAVVGLYKLGGAILASSAKAEIKNFAQSCMMKMVLESEISSFSKNTLKVANAETIEVATRYAFSKSSFENFWKEGCQIVYGEVKVGTKTEHQIAFLYKGIAIAKGTERELSTFLTKLNGLRQSKNAFIEILENLYRLTPKLDETKNFWTCFNKAGTELRWGRQSSKNVEAVIESAINSTNAGKQWEGEVARIVSKYDKVKAVGIEVKYFENNSFKNIAGEYDVLSNRFFIECKESLGIGIINSGKFEEQILKYIDKNNIKFINIENKKVIIAIKEIDSNISFSQPVFQKLLKVAKDNKIELEFKLGINQLKNLK